MPTKNVCIEQLDVRQKGERERKKNQVALETAAVRFGGGEKKNWAKK